MKSALTTALFFSAIPVLAHAGTIVAPVIEQVVLPAPATGEFYIGGTFALNGGVDNTVTQSGLPISGNMYGVFAGYNITSNAPLIYGIEGAYLFGDAIPSVPAGAGLSYMIDAKARLGFRLGGQAMVYGVAGGSFSTYDDGGGATIPVSGFNYGAGVEYRLNPSVFVGVEYLARSLSGDDGFVNPELTVNSTQFRVGIAF